ncbi:unnamed protein product [Acanthocheilonema viteae]|uniref:Glycosyl hydrolase family 38 C-terminal domain-containing protein n=1 Tax=Acanthocheilonema viteae TaxID=6277 RepID=A0A498SMY0_ACAVI|nr:unnamed protein product [Acanthocheilonema viteae]
MYNESSSKKIITMDRTRSVLIYNYEPYEKTERIELQISDPDVILTGKDGPIQAQIEPYFDAVHGKFTENYLLVFFTFLNALSFIRITIQKNHSTTTEIAQILTPMQQSPVTIYFNIAKNGTERLRCEQEFSYYNSTYSGAYIMALENDKLTKLEMNDAETFIVSGSLRQTVYTLSEFIKQRLSVNNITGVEGSHLHMQLHVDIRKMSGVELITKFSTDMIADDIEYYTDSNGMQASFITFYVYNAL